MKFETQLTLIVGIQNIFFYESMKLHTTLGIGGKAKIFLTPTTEEQIIKIVNLCNEYKQDYCVIGNGSKLLVKDSGINKVVICLTNKFSGITQINSTTLSVLSGTSLNYLNKYCMKNGLSGLENTFLIPATVGGAVHNNAGAYNSSFGDIVKTVRVLENCKVKTYTAKECEFGYRTSYFYNKPNIIILSVEICLITDNPENIKARIINILNARLTTQPINKKTAGSTFKRQNNFLPAKAIDNLGLKNTIIGGAKISEKHAGFIENTGNATAQDVLKLIDFISKKVYNTYNVELSPEIIIMGDD